ncbi:MAG: hypothetical protein IJN16_07210 [Lachnospiraceae bacterium]|nr:hypothetical protein [Lachnospiraceae bacterium]
MKKTSVQFHATMEEIALFLEAIVNENELKTYGYIYFPTSQVMEITTFSAEELKKYNEVWISRTEQELSMNVKELLLNRSGDLIIQLGKDDGTELGESCMGVVAEEEIDSMWKCFIKRLKKQLLKGAYVVTPNGTKTYYPNLWYSVGAKASYEKGVIIKPIAGWNYYELEELKQ